MAPIPEKLFKHSANGDDFRNNAKEFVVNMTSHKKKLHILNNKSCYDSKFMYDYLDFNSVDEANKFFKKYEKECSKCDRCFPKK